MTGEGTPVRLELQDSERLEAALERGDGRRHETALGSFQVEGAAVHARWLLCHGAGAGHDSSFLTSLRQAIAATGVQVVAIEFGYMAMMRREGRRRPPPRVERLVDELAVWQHAIREHDSLTPLWLGGKSMGGRVASLLATRAPVAHECAGLVLCGYPFHPPGKPERTRLDHWSAICCPLVVIQGTRDPFGRREEVADYALPPQTEMHFLEGGDHDWQPPKRSDATQDSLIAEASSIIARRLGAR
ncbi:alpha/beta family hydrolase [Salinicola rhizosphaerae]|uniref:Alpha/beta hydrolase n=1 Tax=Salinicola rhizosphaerae TaxID=1443141 RepID=A0ABQ3DUD7_9GAMM|nr:alpha/beta family hydrolase [Salinicola rhizosphaerae]GHB16797.1 alpha/beta hydrolase [Salinicola rhizosphaerae]